MTVWYSICYHISHKEHTNCVCQPVYMVTASADVATFSLNPLCNLLAVVCGGELNLFATKSGEDYIWQPATVATTVAKATATNPPSLSNSNVPNPFTFPFEHSKPVSVMYCCAEGCICLYIFIFCLLLYRKCSGFYFVRGCDCRHRKLGGTLHKKKCPCRE